MAKRICAKFTGKTCLVPRSDGFECQGQRSKFKITGTEWEKVLRHPLWQCIVRRAPYAANDVIQQ